MHTGLFVSPFGAVPVLDRDPPFPGFLAGLPERGLLRPELPPEDFEEPLDDLVEPDDLDPFDDLVEPEDRDDCDCERDLLSDLGNLLVPPGDRERSSLGFLDCLSRPSLP